MENFKRRRQLRDAYRFDGFVPTSTVHGIFGDPKARVVRLARRRKKVSAATVVAGLRVTMTSKSGECGICPVVTPVFTWSLMCGVLTVGCVRG